VIERENRGWSIGDAVLAVLAGFGAALVIQVAIGQEPTAAQVFGLLVPAQTLVTIGVVVALARSSVRKRVSLGLSYRHGDLVGLAIGAGLQVGLSLVLALVIEVLLGGEAPRQEVVEAAGEALGPLDRSLVVIGAGMLAPAAEEIAFRGVLLRALLRDHGPRVATFGTAAAFSMVHLLDPNAFIAVPVLFVVGVVLARQAIATGRLGLPFLTHAGFNLVSVIALFLIEGT
jgi:membrane protease YdiL (CAAX protease family)